MRISLGLLASLLVLGCAHRPLAADASPHGNFAAVVRGGVRARDASRSATPPLVLLVGQADVVVIDPESGAIRWRRPLRVFGTPAVHGRTIVLPVRGHEIQAVDALTGAPLWRKPLPGEALTGLAADDRGVVVTAVERRGKGRSLVAVLSLGDGRLRWQRRSDGLFGVPAVLGPHALVPLEGRVIALAMRDGREVARLDARGLAVDRVELHGDTAIAASAHAFIDLYGGGDPMRRVDTTYAPAFRVVQGLEPGVGHGDGLSWRLLDADSSSGPRDAVFLGRRAVIGIRLSRRGVPIAVRWAYLRHEQREFVALQASDDRVRLISEDGRVLDLDGTSGRPLGEERGAAFEAREGPGARPVLAAAFVGTPALVARSDHRPPDDATVAAALVDILEDPDARLLPAQHLAIDLLWRAEDPTIRGLVKDLVSGAIRPATSPEAEELRGHARLLLDGTWGPADHERLAELLEILSRAKAGGERPGTLLAASREAVRAGGPKVIVRLLSALHSPGTSAADLVEIARALRDLDDSRAVPGVIEFVRRYHADPDVVRESAAIFYAIELLAMQAFPEHPTRVDPRARDQARRALDDLVADRFTVPELRAFLEARLEASSMLSDPEATSSEPSEAPGSP